MDTKVSYSIIDGPDARSLFDACRFVYTKNVYYDVYFKITEYYNEALDGTSCEKKPLLASDFHIVGIEHDNGTGESFRIKGYCNVTENDITENYAFVSYYNTQSKKGIILFSH